jgi:inorganic pyrophosphatase
MIRMPERPARLLRLHAADGAESQRALREAQHLLRGGLCAVCRERDDNASRWLAYFIAESHTDAGVMSRLAAATGFCPAHTRHLLADASAPWLMPQIHDVALRGGLRHLSDQDVRRSPCPACAAGRDAAERARSTLLRVLERPEMRTAISGSTVCLPHLATLAAHADPRQALWLAETASAHLDERPPDVDSLAGLDPDADRRAEQYARLDRFLPVERARQASAVSHRWETDLQIGCCPLCLAEQRAVRRLLRWMATSNGHGDLGREETGLCSRHLHDLTATGGDNVAAILAVNADTWLARLVRFRRRLTEGRDARRSAGPELTRAASCRACEEEATAGRRQLALLAAQVHDFVGAQAYAHTHGVCLRHAVTHHGALPAAARSLLEARLAQLRWEVDEALRKQDWHTRHEVKGAEMRVGRRAPTLLDGRVFAGLPAPPAMLDTDLNESPPRAAGRRGRCHLEDTVEFDVIVEIPQGSRNKYEMDHELHRIRLDRLLFTSTKYPADYGYIEGTLGRDGDPLDALVLVGEPTFPGCTIECRAVGMFVMKDEHGPDEKVLCVPAHDPRHTHVRDMKDIPEFDRLEITHFFEVYKDLEPGKSVEGSHWEGRDQAYAEIEASRARATEAAQELHG